MSFVNAQSAENVTEGSLSQALPSIDAVSGNVLVVHTHYYSTADRTFSCAGGGLTWIEDTGASFYDATDDWGGRAWYAVAASTTGVVATVSNDLGTSFIACAIMQYDSYSSWIGSVNNRQTAPGTGANGVTSGVLDITSQPARQIGTFLNYPAASPPTPIGTVRIAGWSSGYGVVSDRQITSTGNSAATATAAGGQGSATHYSVQSSFAETGGGSPTEIDAESQALSLAEQAATVRSHFSLAATVDAFTLSEQAGTVSISIRQLVLTAAQNRELRDHTNAVVASLADIIYQWYDDPDDTDGAPTQEGTFSTDENGEASIVLTQSSLGNGDFGGLILIHPSDSTIRGYYRVPVTVTS